MKVTSIRFNLKFFNAGGGEEVVRTLADLRAKFNLSDLYEYFKSGDLLLWLKGINEPKIAESVESLRGMPDRREMLSALCLTLGMSLDRQIINRFCDILDRQDVMRNNRQSEDIHLKDYKPAMASDDKANPSYIECLNGVLASSDMQTAHNAVSSIMNLYSDKFIRDILRTDDPTKKININIFVWCALLGYNKCSDVLRSVHRICVWVRKSPGLDAIRFRVGFGTVVGSVDGGRTPCAPPWLYDGYFSDLKMSKNALFAMSGVPDYENMAECLDYDVTEAITRFFRW